MLIEVKVESLILTKNLRSYCILCFDLVVFNLMLLMGCMITKFYLPLMNATLLGMLLKVI